jgi:hypothetical protein
MIKGFQLPLPTITDLFHKPDPWSLRGENLLAAGAFVGANIMADWWPGNYFLLMVCH